MARYLIAFCVLASMGLCIIAEPAAACSVCFGEEGNPQTEGMNMAILTLLGVTWGILGMMGTAGFFFWRRARLFSTDFNPSRLDGDAAGDAEHDA